MLKKIAVLIGLTFLLGACATTHPGQLSASTQRDVVISVNQNEALSDKYYLFLEYTIENKSSQWKDVQFVSSAFGNGPSEILVNEKLRSWIEGAELKFRKGQYNTALVLGSIAAVGGVASASSSSKNVQAAGLAAASGALVAATVNDATNSYNGINSGTKGLNGTVYVPRNHIYHTVKVAPESYIRRWVVIASPTQIPTRAGRWHQGNLVTKAIINQGQSETFSTKVPLRIR